MGLGSSLLGEVYREETQECKGGPFMPKAVWNIINAYVIMHTHAIYQNFDTIDVTPWQHLFTTPKLTSLDSHTCQVCST